MKEYILKERILIGLMICVVLVSGCTPSTMTCPDTELYNFDVKIESKEQAIGLFNQYFSENPGHIFNESLVFYDEYQEGYRYQLYIIKDDGEFIRQGYCK